MIGAGILLLALGIILALFVNSTIGVILAIAGVALLVLGYTGYGAGGRRDVVIERDRPQREIIRER